MKLQYKGWIFVLTLAVLLIAAGALAEEESKNEKQGQTDIHEYIRAASLQNGSSIYYYGVNRWGERVPVLGGPRWLYMRGGGCVQCHGPNGQGGIWPMMCGVEAPAITYKALTSEEHEHGSETTPSGKNEEEHPPYTIRTIQIAIEQGVDPGGEQLNWCMPRWGLSPIDFRDLLAYLVYLGGGVKKD